MINTIKLAKIFAHLVGLVVIVLSCQTKSNHKLPIIHMRYYSDNLSLADYKKINFKIENQKKTKTSEYNPKVKYRGNSSFKYTKKSYSLKFKNPRPLFHLPASKFWKLNAEYIDKTLMRNKLSYTLFRSFSPENFAPRVNYAVLYENQYYQGIYSVTEAVDEYRLELNLSDADAVLFKEPPFHNPPSEHNERAKKFAEYSQRSKRYITFSPKARKKLIAESYYNQRYPKAVKKNKKEVIYDVTDFLFNSSDSIFQEQIFKDYFSAQNVMDWHLLLLITQNGDGIKKNNYIYRKSSGQPFLYIPWDFDHSFGREGDGEPMNDKLCDLTQHILFKRLIEINPNNYLQKLNARFLSLKKQDILTVKNIFELIDDNVKKLRPEIEANESRWPLNEVSYFKKSSFEMEVNRMKEWIENHLPKVEQHLNILQKR